MHHCLWYWRNVLLFVRYTWAFYYVYYFPFSVELPFLHVLSFLIESLSLLVILLQTLVLLEIQSTGFLVQSHRAVSWFEVSKWSAKHWNKCGMSVCGWKNTTFSGFKTLLFSLFCLHYWHSTFVAGSCLFCEVLCIGVALKDMVFGQYWLWWVSDWT